MTANIHDAAVRQNRYAEHVTQLGAAFNIQIVADPNMAPENAGMGLTRTKKNGRVIGTFIKIVPVIDETTYAVALHELGHALHPTGNLHSECSKAFRDRGEFEDLRDIRLVLESERSAWSWARQYALEWTPAMSAVHNWAIETYLKMARKFGLKEPKEVW